MYIHFYAEVSFYLLNNDICESPSPNYYTYVMSQCQSMQGYSLGMIYDEHGRNFDAKKGVQYMESEWE